MHVADWLLVGPRVSSDRVIDLLDSNTIIIVIQYLRTWIQTDVLLTVRYVAVLVTILELILELIK